MEYLHQKAIWRFEAMQYGFNAIASIGGGTSVPQAPKMSAAQSGISGAFAGAAMGSVAGPPGAVIGGLIGGIAGLL